MNGNAVGSGADGGSPFKGSKDWYSLIVKNIEVGLPVNNRVSNVCNINGRAPEGKAQCRGIAPYLNVSILRLSFLSTKETDTIKSFNLVCKPKEVSGHFLVEVDGSIHEMVAYNFVIRGGLSNGKMLSTQLA